jgi:hypothetical protein
MCKYLMMQSSIW